MATQSGAAQRRGGTKQRQYNEDRTVGARSGVPIPEMSRDDDDFEDFEKLIDAGLQGRDLPAIERPVNQKQGSSSKRKSTFSKVVDDGDGERSMDLTDVQHTPRTVAPLSSQTTRSPAIPRPRTVDFDSVPSPRTTRNLSVHDSRNSTYSGRTSAYGGFRNMAGPPEDLGDIDPDAYIDYTGGGQDQPSSPLAVISPPPSLVRKTPISSRRSPKPERPARSPARGSTPRARHSAALRESNSAMDEHLAPKQSPKAVKGHSSRPRARDTEPVDEPYDAPDSLDMGGVYEYEDGGDMDDGSVLRDLGPLEDHNRDRREPSKTGMESFDDDDDDDAPLAQKTKAPKGKKAKAEKAKPNEPQKVSKKRARDDDQENIGQPKKKKAPTSKASSKPRSKAEPPPDQSYFEELAPPSDFEEFEEVGVRRSARCRFAPVAFWRGERLEYTPWRPGTERQCPEIRGVRRIREEPFWKSRRARNKRQAKDRGRSFTVEYDEESAKPPEFEWDKDTPRDGVVVDLFTEEELRRRLVCTAHMLQPRYTANGDFAFQKILSDGEFVAAGYVEIPIGKVKPRKSTKDNTYIFYVIEGAVLVGIHNDEYILSPGSIFMVPRGNYYFIQNISKRKVKLLFAQGRQVGAEEGEEMSSRFPSEAADASPAKQRRSEPYEDIGYDDRIAGGSRASVVGRSYVRARPRESTSPRKRGQSQPILPARRR